MRTVKKTHNIKLREKCKAGRDGFEILLCSENRFSEKYVHLEIVSGRDHATTITTMAAGKEGSEKRKSSNEEQTHSCALLRRPTTLSIVKTVRLGEMGSKYRSVVKIGSQKIRAI